MGRSVFCMRTAVKSFKQNKVGFNDATGDCPAKGRTRGFTFTIHGQILFDGSDSPG